MKIIESHIMEEGEKRYRMCEDLVQDVDETIFDPESPTLHGDIFRESQREYGRCVSKVYLDTPDEGIKAIGWVFVKREKYEDSKETYLHETWISLYDEYEYKLHSTPHYL